MVEYEIKENYIWAGYANMFIKFDFLTVFDWFLHEILDTLFFCLDCVLTLFDLNLLFQEEKNNSIYKILNHK